MRGERGGRRFEGVLFDYGGTLVSNREADEILYEILTFLNIPVDRKKFDVAFAGMRAYWHERYSSMPRGSRWSRRIMEDCDSFLLQSIGISSNVAGTAAAIQDNWSAVDRRVPFSDVHSALAAIRNASLRTGVVSQNSMMSRSLKSEMETLGIAHYFDTVVTSEEEGFDKPDPRLFLAASSKLGIPPERLMHVGDIYEKDVEGARAAGMTPVLLDRDGRFRNSHVMRIEGLAEIVSMITALPETKSAENGAS